MKKIYELPDKLVREWNKHPHIDGDEFIRSIGFKSCVFRDVVYRKDEFTKIIGFKSCVFRDVVYRKDEFTKIIIKEKGYWEMSDEDYTWFMLRWA